MLPEVVPAPDFDSERANRWANVPLERVPGIHGGAVSRFENPFTTADGKQPRTEGIRNWKVACRFLGLRRVGLAFVNPTADPKNIAVEI